jgi:hypothetical protein
VLLRSLAFLSFQEIFVFKLRLAFVRHLFRSERQEEEREGKREGENRREKKEKRKDRKGETVIRMAREGEREREGALHEKKKVV